VQHLLASGREIDTRRRSTFNNKTAAEQGRAMGARTKGADDTDEDHQRKKTNGPHCADLIDGYEKDAAKVRSQLRKQLGPRGISFPSPLSHDIIHSTDTDNRRVATILLGIFLPLL